MARLYKRDRSPFYWLEFRGPGGVINRISTKCRIGNGMEEKQARKLALNHSLQELELAEGAKDDRWENWVPGFIEVRYKGQPRTRERYLAGWGNLTMFLKEHKIERPCQLQRKHCFDYLEWRQRPDKRIGKYKAGHNTALLEVTTLRMLMSEAVARGICQGNPCVKLGIRKQPGKIKPELTDEIIKLIREKIAEEKDPNRREFYSNSFEIARYQGCRISETQINPMTDVTIKGRTGTILFWVKGGKEHRPPLHPALIPLFKRLRAAGRTTTWAAPAGASYQWAPTTWFRFLRRHGFKRAVANICFHSTRVTVVSRMAQNNVPISKAMEYVKHASTTIHRSYQRWQPSDLKDCTDAVGH